MLDIRDHIVLLFLSFFLICISASAQELKNYSTSDLKYFAAEAEASGDHLSAAEYFEELTSRKPKKDIYQYKLARNFHLSSQFSKARPLYEQLSNEQSDKYPLAAFYLGRLLIMEGNCEKAVDILNDFQRAYRGQKDDRKYRRLAKFSVEACTEKKFEEKGNFIIKALPSDINGSNMEGSPIFESKDRIIYSSLKANPNTRYNADEALPEPNFYVAERKNGEWTAGAIWDQLKMENGYMAVSGAFNQDRSRLYISACKDLHSPQMQCDLFRVSLKNGNWGNVEKLNETINGKFQERHPAVGIDEKGRETLYFVSDRDEGKGGYDIWYSTYYEKKDDYREPKNCGSKVNSVGDEISPFVDPESGILFFSSNGHPGIGGFDVFRSSGSRSKWMEPVNIGSNINGPMDELYYVIDPSGQSGMFVSNRTYGKKKQPCCDDLFYFTDPDLIRLNYDGLVKDDKGEVLDQATISIFELDDSTGEEYIRKKVKTDKDGIYNFRLEPDKRYRVKAEKDGYFTDKRELLTVGKMSSANLKLDFSLEPMTDKAFVLENIYYDFNESDLTEKATLAIDTGIYDILVENPTIVVEIGSHTDSKGRSEYNQNLSQNRAESVVKYLIKRGIRADRLRAKGYGETKPVAPNKNVDGSDNPEGRAKNRRTEFKVIGEIELRDDED